MDSEGVVIKIHYGTTGLRLPGGGGRAGFPLVGGVTRGSIVCKGKDRPRREGGRVKKEGGVGRLAGYVRLSVGKVEEGSEEGKWKDDKKVEGKGRTGGRNG